MVRLEYDKLFADMEFRSKRAAMMNYHEANRYKKKSVGYKRSENIQVASSVLGGLGLTGIAASVAKTAKLTASRTGLAGVLSLPLVAVLEFISNGSSKLAPTVAEKAQKHTEVGAGWQRIARITRGHRVQLKWLPDERLELPVLSEWYREIVEASEQVSRVMPIKNDTYLKFDEPQAVKDNMNRREKLVNTYMALEKCDGQ